MAEPPGARSVERRTSAPSAPAPTPADPLQGRVDAPAPGVTPSAPAPTAVDPAPAASDPPPQALAGERVLGSRRQPAARLSPERLAAARGGVKEGLAWLGREPESHATLLYRVVRLLARFLVFVVFRFRIDAQGRELLPATGGYLLVGAAHRGWMDPFVIMFTLPVEPRCWFLGSGPSTFTNAWRETFLRRLGGLLPVWRGGIGVEQHVASARAVLRGGGVFVQMPEGTVSGPPGRVGPFRNGAALLALRTGAPIVPLAVVGTEELYLGRRMASRVLPPTSARELLGDSWDGVLPLPGSRAELELARRLTGRLEATLGPAVEELYPSTVDPPDHPRRLRSRLTWLLLAPGRVDRDLTDAPPRGTG